MKQVHLLILLLFGLLGYSFSSNAQHYERDKAVPVQKVLFGQIQSIKHITEQEIYRDQQHGWDRFGGALIGGVIGHQFGGGSGQVAATILGALIGSNIAKNQSPSIHIYEYSLIELMIETERDGEFLVVQNLDPMMTFKASDKIRLIYLANGTVRVDLAY